MSADLCSATGDLSGRHCKTSYVMPKVIHETMPVFRRSRLGVSQQGFKKCHDVLNQTPAVEVDLEGTGLGHSGTVEARQDAKTTRQLCPIGFVMITETSLTSVRN